MFTRIGELPNALAQSERQQTQQRRRHQRNSTVEEEIGRAFRPARMLPPTPSFGNNDNTNARPTASSCNTASSFRPSFPCSSSGNELEDAPHQGHHIPPYHQMASLSQLPSRPTPIYTVRRNYQPFRGVVPIDIKKVEAKSFFSLCSKELWEYTRQVGIQSKFL